MGTLNPNIPSPELNKALNAAATRMRALKLPLLGPGLLLLTFARDADSIAHRLLVQFAAERSFRLDELAASTEVLAKGSAGADADFVFMDDAGRPVPLSAEMLVALDEGRSIAQAADEIFVGTEHALGGLAERGVSTAPLLRRYGITAAAMTDRLANEAQTRRLTSQDLVARAKAGEAAPVYVRADLMRDLLGLLALANHRHVILVGDAGVGRRSLVGALALLMAEGKGPADLSSLIQVPEQALLADAEKSVDAGWRQARDGILFIPNIERFFGGALTNPEFPRATRAVQRAFLSPRPVVVGTTTDAAWNERLAADSAVRDYSLRLRVPEPSVEETAAILAVHKPGLEHDYKIAIGEGALPAAAGMSKRYVAGIPLPASALAALHRACALLKLAGQPQAAFRPEGVQPDAELGADDVAVAVSVMTGIPVSKLGVDERARYAHMVEALHQRIIGQEEAVLAVSRAVKIARVGLKDAKRPIGSFLFLGPTGVGKTELAKALAEFMFGS
jgi:ATP-dependent Clp protease ATP-binding subunit ClpC